MSFELISEITRWTARLSFILFATAFVLDGVRNGHRVVRKLWQAYAATMLIYFISLTAYHFIINQWPQFDLLNGLLSIGALLFLASLWTRRNTQPTSGHLFAPLIPSYYLAVLYLLLPISRILPVETNHLIYHLMLYSMGVLFILRVGLDIRARFKAR